MLKGYLAGPIENVSSGVATGWRRVLKMKFKDLVLFHSPVCDDSGKRETSAPIFGRDRLQIKDSHFIICNLINPPPLFMGTLIEIGIALEQQKLIIVVTNDNNIRLHPFMDRATVVFGNMEDAVKYITDIAYDFL